MRTNHCSSDLRVGEAQQFYISNYKSIQIFHADIVLCAISMLTSLFFFIAIEAIESLEKNPRIHKSKAHLTNHFVQI